MPSLLGNEGYLHPNFLQQNPDSLLTDNYNQPSPMANQSVSQNMGGQPPIDPRRAAWSAALANIGNIIGGQSANQSISGAYMNAKQYNDRARGNAADARRREDEGARQSEIDDLNRRNIESQIAKRDIDAAGGGVPFAGTGIEAQMLNKYLGGLPADERAQAESELVRQRLERERTTVTPEGTYTQPGYSLQPQAPQTMPPPAVGQPGQQSPPQAPPSPLIPAFTPKPLTGEQAKVVGFYDRMVSSQGEIDRILGENPNFDPTDIMESMAESVPLIGNMMISPERQQYRQAAKDWIRAKLRRESGAVIGEEEADEEYRTYFPIPGDSKEAIEQKRRSRKTAEKAMRSSTGPQANKKIRRYNPETGRIE